MTVKELSSAALSRLRPSYGDRESEAIVRLIWEHLKGWQPVDLVLHYGDEVGLALTDDFEKIVSRLEAQEPLQYILGEARFFGLNLHVDRNVLIPRPETEGLVQLILDDYREASDLKVVDVCTGSGAIALALGRHLAFPQIIALDISAEALTVAKENAKALKVRIESMQADVLSKQTTLPPCDVVVSNPPYILENERESMSRNVLDYEPDIALFAPVDDDVAFYREIAGKAFDALSAGGRLYFELNPLTADKVRALVEALGFEEVQILKDIHGRRRYLKARKPA